jgi:hypothetical protein
MLARLVFQKTIFNNFMDTSARAGLASVKDLDQGYLCNIDSVGGHADRAANANRRSAMGFWHTGYAEFHEATGLEGGQLVLPRLVFACEQCSRQFDELEDLRRRRARGALVGAAGAARTCANGSSLMRVTTATPLRSIMPQDVVLWFLQA